MKCPDCKEVMEHICPNNMEDYYKCPRCRLEMTIDEVEDLLEG